MTMSLALPVVEFIRRQRGFLHAYLLSQCVDDSPFNLVHPFRIAAIDLSELELHSESESSLVCHARQKRHFVWVEHPRGFFVEFIPCLDHGQRLRQVDMAGWIARRQALYCLAISISQGPNVAYCSFAPTGPLFVGVQTKSVH